jgi:hypothetical protein
MNRSWIPVAAFAAFLVAPNQSPQVTTVELRSATPGTETEIIVRSTGAPIRVEGSSIATQASEIRAGTPVRLLLPAAPRGISVEVLASGEPFHVSVPSRGRSGPLEAWGRSLTLERATGDSGLRIIGGDSMRVRVVGIQYER